MKTQNATTPAFAPAEILKSFHLPGVDVEALMASQKKNLDAIVEAQRVAVEGMQTVARRQEEIVRGAFEEVQKVAKAAKSPEAYLTLATEMARKSLDQVREIAELTAKANQDVVDVVTRRATEGFEELKSLVKIAKA